LHIKLPTQFNDKSESRDRDLSLLSNAALFFHKHLKETQKGKVALEYLKSRKISQETTDEFLLGYAPESWDALLQAALKKEYTIDELLEAGLVIKNNNKDSHYDRFRNRVMFPITNISGKIIGFGARVLDESLPKYLNSPDNKVFNKGKNLFGLDKARRSIIQEKSVIIVEGYMDFLAIYQQGIKNVVATLGTALTSDHAHMLRRYTEHVVLLYDSDSAGVSAAARSIDIFLRERFAISVVTLKDAKDPDEYISKFGVEKFRNYIKEQSTDFFDFKLKTLSENKFPTQEAKKAFVASTMFETLNLIENSILKSEYLHKLALCLDVDLRAIQDEYSKKQIKSNMAYRPSQDKEKVKPRVPKLEQAEKMILKLIIDKLVSYDKLLILIKKYDVQFSIPEFTLVSQLIGSLDKENISSLFSKIENEKTRQELSELAFIELPAEDVQKIIKDCMQIIIIHHLEKQIADLIKEQEIALKIDKEKWEAITNKIISLKREKTKIIEKGVNI